MSHKETTKQVQSDLNPLAADGKVGIMTSTKTNYQGLFDYAKENTQTRNLFQEYWQQNKKQAPDWQTKLNPKLERSVIPTIAINLQGYQAKPLSELRSLNIDYSGLFEYAQQNAVNRDLFKDSVHPNLNNWQSSLKVIKGSKPSPAELAKAA